MQQTFLTAVFMPLALGVIMLGLGLSLTPADFGRVVKYPRAVFVGLFCQVILLPAACALVATAFGLPSAMAVGLMLLAASPGGATANLFSHLARGDVALNITLTAVNSVVSLFTLPLIVNWSLAHFMGQERAIPLVFDKVVQVFAIVLIPVGIGMLLRAKREGLAKRLERPVKVLSAAFLAVVILASVLKERSHLADFFRQVGLAALAFNLLSMSVGYLVPRLVRLPRRQATAIGMEIGIHNGTLAIAVASSPMLLNDTRMAIPPAIYSLIMFFTAAAFGYWSARQPDDEAAAAQELPG